MKLEGRVALIMGTLFCCQAIAPSMKALGWGRIVNTSWQAGLQAQQGGVYASYGVAKAAEFFITDLGDYITGQCLSVCGGAIRG